MKCQFLFSMKNKTSISKCRLLEILHRVLRDTHPFILTLKAPSKIFSRRYSKIFFLFFSENEAYFSEKTSLDRKLILTFHVNQADDSHEISRLVFSEKEKKKMLSAAVGIGALRVKFKPMGKLSNTNIGALRVKFKPMGKLSKQFV